MSCQEEFKPRVREKPRPMQALVLFFFVGQLPVVHTLVAIIVANRRGPVLWLIMVRLEALRLVHLFGQLVPSLRDAESCRHHGSFYGSFRGCGSTPPGTVYWVLCTGYITATTERHTQVRGRRERGGLDHQRTVA